MAAGLSQYLYQGMKKYAVIGLLKIYWSKLSENIIPNSICIIFSNFIFQGHCWYIKRFQQCGFW